MASDLAQVYNLLKPLRTMGFSLLHKGSYLIIGVQTRDLCLPAGEVFSNIFGVSAAAAVIYLVSADRALCPASARKSLEKRQFSCG